MRAGSISLEIEKNSEWMNRVKASLFSGGIDPQTVMSELENIMESRGRNSLRGEAKKLEYELRSMLG